MRTAPYEIAQEAKSPRRSPVRWLVVFFGVWAGLVGAFLLLAQFTAPDQELRAVTGMAGGLFVLWILGCGGLMLLVRDRVRRILGRIRTGWQIVFVLFAIGLALIEEAITTAMTNAAPLWGVPVGKVAITASPNYLEVVLYHSVVVFVPMFVAWAWLLTRYAFSAEAVFVLFGLNGVLAETMSFGGQNVVMAGFWVYVYGLMVYLPAFSLPRGRAAKRPGVWAVALALVLPILAAVPVALAVVALHPASAH